MHGQRQQKQPDKKEAIKRMENAQLLAAMREMELEQLNKNWGLKFDMVVKMFEAAISNAATIGEAKHWYRTWAEQVNAIDHTADDAEQQMDAIIEQHGFEFTITPVAVPYQEMCGRKN
ncbi:hypothetical protein [Thiomicrorhabdus sp.]|uniref:hypothetical protein n=1 Tax=Thiomicrorhabdus sp. TaxID=2039724 RepID=UPI003563A266